MSFTRFFLEATGYEPFPYQVRLAESTSLPEVLSIPTGLGKTAGVVLAWAWRRFHADNPVRAATPRRLVYCLPTRVLVRQTVKSIETWLQNIGLSSEQSGRGVRIVTVMGGESSSVRERDSWVVDPLDEMVLVGTQDMLLSRALNRGYAMSRFTWPIPFALLNCDSLWVLDETQLMGPGLTTSVQLAGLRRKLGTSGPSRTLWMSATIYSGRLDTIDNPGQKQILALDEEDRRHVEIGRKLYSLKSCSPAVVDGQPLTLDSPTYAKDLSAFVRRVHIPGTLTLVIVNTVGRCQEVYRRLRDCGAEVRIIHSGFRGFERDRLEQELSSAPDEKGTILVSTQVVEAGVDMSAVTLVTEPAPWPSLVQRIGRCNRYGERNESGASVYWITPSEKEANSLPYAHEEVLEGVRLLSSVENASPENLGSISFTPKEDPPPVLRRKDIIELFDTTPDLLGFDLDISRFIREAGEPDVHVFWRELPGDKPEESVQDARPEELCRVSLSHFAEFLKKQDRQAYAWNHITGRWAPAHPGRLMPGATYLLDASAGGYSDQLGWTGDSRDRPTPSTGGIPADHQSADRMTSEVQQPVTIEQHSGDVAREIEGFRDLVSEDLLPLLHRAALWHDAGKAHPVFLEAAGAVDGPPLAKSPRMKPYSRRGFRHELASALMALQSGEPDLLCYLVAAHHGKVRMSLRSQYDESLPEDRNRRHARGIHEGDEIPPLDLGEGISVPGMMLDLRPMELGGGGCGPSWRTLSQGLLDAYGPFRLAWLEALLRIADWRASAKEAGNA